MNGGDYVGGIVGVCQGQSTIRNVYTLGEISGGMVGGIVGFIKGYVYNVLDLSAATSWAATGEIYGNSNIRKASATESAAKYLALYKNMDWNIDATGTDVNADWRIYEGQTFPLLTCFFKGTKDLSGMDAIYDG